MVGAFLAEKRGHEWMLNIFFKKKFKQFKRTKQSCPKPSFCDIIWLFQGILLNQTPLVPFDALIISQKSGINCN